MTLTILGWILVGVFASVIVIALAMLRILFPRDLFEPTEDEMPPPRPDKPPLPEGVVDLKEYRRGHWK